MKLAIAQLRRDQRIRKALSALQALVAEPADLVAGFQLPAGVDLVLSSAAVTAAPTALITANGVNLSIPASAAGARHVVGYVERGVTIAKKAGYGNVVSVYARDAFGVPLKIAEG